MIFRIKTTSSLCILVIFLSVVQWQCRKNQPDGIPISYISNLTIPAGLNVIDTHIFELPEEQPRLGVFLPETDTSRIASITASVIRIRNLQSNADLSYIRRAVVRISAEGLPEREVAFREEVPFNTGLDLDLIPSLSELRPYFLKDRFRLIVRLNFRNISPETMTLQLESGFQVYVDE